MNISRLNEITKKELENYLVNAAYHNIDILYNVTSSSVDKERWSVLIRAYEIFIDGVINNK